MTEDKLKQSLAILDPIRTVELKDKTGNFEAILEEAVFKSICF